jgi:secretion/DNA translocation related TadE-like protein
VVAAVAGCLLTIAGYVGVAHHVRSAADLVALSGASGLARGQDGCQVAREAARRNAARVVACESRGDSLDFVVTVTVAQSVTAASSLLPGELRATASAGRLGLLR